MAVHGAVIGRPGERIGLRSIVTTVYDDNVGNVYGNINFTLTNYDGVSSCTNGIRTGFYNGAWHVTGALSDVGLVAKKNVAEFKNNPFG